MMENEENPRETEEEAIPKKSEGEENPQEIEKETKPKKTRRKRASVRKSFTRSKRRGQHTSKTQCLESTLPIIGLGDPDLAECLLSDEEERAEFLRDIQVVACNIQSQSATHSDDESSSDRPGSACPFESVSDQTSAYSSEGSGCVFSPGSDVCPKVRPAPCPAAYFSMESGSPKACDSPSEIFNYEHVVENSSEGALTADIEAPELRATSSGVSPEVSQEVVEKALSKLRSKLPSSWTPIADKWGFHFLQICNQQTKQVQKQISISFDGAETILVHCTPLPFAKDILDSVSPASVKFEENTLEDFTQRGCNIVRNLLQYDVCAGANDKERKELWDFAPDSYIDLNPFGEAKYDETCRSTSCLRLTVLGKGMRCNVCSKLQNILRKRQIPSASAHPFTNNRYLTTEQAQQKLKLKQEEIRKKDKQIAYLKNRIKLLLEDEGVDIDKKLSDDLSTILASAELSEVQKLFLEEQLKYAGKSDKRGMRWHPTMIRLALSIRMISSSAYEALRDSGAIKLPSSRTLYDYSRPFPPEVGVSEGLLRRTAEKVSKLKHPRKFVTVIADEVYVSRNLVYRQSDGVLLGYVHLEEVEKELARFENSYRLGLRPC